MSRQNIQQQHDIEHENDKVTPDKHKTATLKSLTYLIIKYQLILAIII